MMIKDENKFMLHQVITVLSIVKSLRAYRMHPTGEIEEYAENKAVYDILDRHIEPILNALYSENYNKLKTLLDEFSSIEHKRK